MEDLQTLVTAWKEQAEEGQSEGEEARALLESARKDVKKEKSKVASPFIPGDSGNVSEFSDDTI